MKVIYLGPTEAHTLEHGRVYEVLSEEDGWYRLIDKSGEDYLYPKNEFKILEDSHKTGSTLTEYAEKLQKQEK